MRRRFLVVVFCGLGLALTLAGCSKAPDITGAWFFDYASTKLESFPNPEFESARALIEDVEPRYGSISVDGDTVVLGGAVCKIRRINDDRGLRCEERREVSELGLFVEGERLVVKRPADAGQGLRMVFSRTKQDPYVVYGVDPNAKPVVEEAPREQVAEPTPEAGADKLVGYARTWAFNAFYVSDSIKNDGRHTTVRVVLNYLEPQTESSAMRAAWSSVQVITFDCPGSNYRLDRYVQFSERNGLGAVVSDSDAYTDYQPEMKPVPEGSVNKVLYMRVCR